MRFIDLLLLAGLWGLTGCAEMMQKGDQKVLLRAPSQQCHAELVAKIKALTGIGHVTISNDAFTKSATLILTNHPRAPYPAVNPLAGVIGSEKMLQLLQRKGVCRIALLDEKGEIVRSLPLQACDCKPEEDQ